MSDTQTDSCTESHLLPPNFLEFIKTLKPTINKSNDDGPSLFHGKTSCENLPGPFTPEWESIVSYFELGAGSFSEKSEIARYFRTSASIFIQRLNRDLKARHGGVLPDAARMQRKRRIKDEYSSKVPNFPASVAAAGVTVGYSEVSDGALRVLGDLLISLGALRAASCHFIDPHSCCSRNYECHAQIRRRQSRWLPQRGSCCC